MSASQNASAERSAFVTALVTRIRSVAGSPEMLAIQAALPRSFIGLAVGLAAFMALRPGTLLARFSSSFAAAFGVMSALLLVLLTLDLARRRQVSAAPALAIACVAFGLALPFASAVALPPGLAAFSTVAKALGSSGLFLAIGIALATVDLASFAARRFGTLRGTLLAGVSIVGAAAVLLARGISLSALLGVVIAPLGRLGDSLEALLILTLVETLLWTIGIHGPALLAPVVLPVYIDLQLQNTEALSRGLPLPHIVTVSLFLFVFPGGAGATLPLVLLLLRSKVKRVKRIALATFLPSLVNINEPLMFGLPLVLNPVLGVPFVIAPLVLATVSYEAIALGLVARPAYYIPSAIPIPFGGYLATKDWRSVVLTLADIALGLAIYLPFVKAYERQERLRVATPDAA